MRETTVRIGDLLERIDAGWSPPCSEGTPRSGEWGVLKVSAVTSGNYRPGRIEDSPARAEAPSRD